MKNDNSNTPLKRGRPPKKDYDPEALMRELIDTVNITVRQSLQSGVADSSAIIRF